MRKRTSNETFIEIVKNGDKKIVSFLPTDRHDCDCFGLVRSWNEKLSRMTPELRLKSQKNPIDCPRSKGMKKYEIYCSDCGDLIAYINADNEQLDNWCNLHYVSEAKIGKETQIFHEEKKIKGKIKLIAKEREVEIGEWYGCMGLQISPIDDKLGFECSCGNDTRDFRIKNNLTGLQLKDKLNNNMINRDFSTNSKFIAKEIK